MAFHPLIGVSASVDEKETKHFLLKSYECALLGAGAVPLLISPWTGEDALRECLDRLDGVFLAGGNDLAPELYGCDPIEQLGEVNPVRDRFELALTRLAFDRDMPVLGICRGMQTMNVAMGGTLWQDLPSQYRTPDGQSPMAHVQKRMDCYPSHSVRLERDSRLFRALGQEELRVNSFHHQAVRAPGQGLRITARATDGVPEALEHESHPFFLAVQWHPERYYDRAEDALALFRAFAQAAAAYGAKK